MLKFLMLLLVGTGWISAVDAKTKNTENVYIECSPNEMKLTLVTSYPFHGRLYVPSSAADCHSDGQGATHTQLTIPIESEKCGVFKQSEDSYVAIATIQHHPLVQQFGDRALRLECNYGLTNYTVSSGVNNILDPSPRRGEVVDSTSPSPRINLRILNVDGTDVTEAKLGQKLIIKVEIDDNSIFNLAPKGLIASSGRSSEHLELLDENGCPIDNGVFKGLFASSHSKTLQGEFRAFKFSDDVIVRFHMNVQFCVNNCPIINCNELNGGGRRNKRSEWPIGSQEGLKDPFLPLQKEIIVDGSIDGSALPFSIGHNMEEELVCVTKTVFIVVVVIVVIVQLCLLVTSVICIWVAKKYRNGDDDDSLHSDHVPCIEPHSGDAIFYSQDNPTRL
ncbi:hypothetical protein CHUAL_006357 [Chamberlinius hualienensis]